MAKMNSRITEMNKRMGKIFYAFLIMVAWLTFNSNQANAQFGMGNTLAPLPGNDYPIIFTNDAKGGHHQVATIADRDLITSLRRQPGMLCTVMDDGTGKTVTYQLICEDTKEARNNNANWVVFSGSGSGISIDGKSAYDLWLEIPTNAGKTLEEFFTALRGEIGPEGKSTFQTWEAITENNGKSETDFFEALKGAEGKSAFEIWKLVINDDTKTMPEYIEAMKGLNGLSAFDLWLELPENIGKTYDDYLLAMKGSNGKSAFDLWLEIPENKEKNITDFFNSLKGDTGLSAYSEWANLPANNGKTFDDFLASLKGQAGASAFDQWLLIPENSGKKFEDFLTSLKGENGISAFEVWQLQAGNENKTEADFLEAIKGSIGQSAFEVWQAQTGNENKTEAEFLAGLKGANGLSVYEIWKLQSGNENKTEAEFLAGLQAVQGETGKSAYQIWENIAENKGKTEAEYLEALKGETGLSAYQIWEAITENKGKTEAEYLEAIKGLTGKSAFEVWQLQAGNENKTEADYLEAIKGSIGNSAFEVWQLQAGNENKTEAEYLEAIKGKQGLSSLEVWKAIPGNENKPDLDYWASLRGIEGKSAFEVWLERPENVNKNINDYNAFMKGKAILSGLVDPISSDGMVGEFYINTVTQTLFGPKVDETVWPTGTPLKGTDGTSLDFKGTFDNLDAYKAIDGNTETLNKSYYNRTDKKSYIHNGTEWKILAQDGAGAINFNGNRPITGLPTVGMNPGTDDLGKWIENVFYPTTKPNVSISANPALGIREMGSAGSSTVTLNWSASRVAGTSEITAITVDGNSVFTASPAENASVSGSVEGTITSNTPKTFTITATTKDGKTSSASTSVEFQYKRYYGFISGGEDGEAFVPSNAQILALSNSSFGTSAPFSAQVTPNGRQKLVIAYPAAWGGTKIIVGVNDSTGAFTKSTQTVTNASGGSTNYVIFVQKDNTAAGYSVAVQ